MNRISLILIFMIWLSWAPSEPTLALPPSGANFAVLGGALAGALLALGIWSRRMANRMGGTRTWQDRRWFGRLTKWMRGLIPAWFGVAVFLFSWPEVVMALLSPLQLWGLVLPGFLLGTAPALAAWVLMWWAVYPAERAVREQAMLEELDANLPVRTFPTLRQYLAGNVRLQILFLMTPIVFILLLRDLLGIALQHLEVRIGENLELALSVGTLLLVMLLASVLLVRVLPTRRLPDSPLRERLEALCRAQGLRVRDILLWDTHGHMGNAAVMGVVPGLRYLLVTDLILETMPDEQIVAVFAHEIGHVRHRHLWWIGAFVLLFTLVAAGPGTTLWRWLEGQITMKEPYASLGSLAVVAPLFYWGFGHLSRRFERQADLFAARTAIHFAAEEKPEHLTEDTPPQAPRAAEALTPAGAGLICSALYRIARVNRIPVEAHEWLHGSIGWRIRFLEEAARDPEKALAFDRLMRRVYLGIVAMILVFGAWTVWEMR